MKIKVFSWIVGVVYVFCGFMFLLILAKFKDVFSELETPLPLLTRVLFSPTPAGWFAALLCGGVGAVLKDFKFTSPWANLVFTVVLLAAVVFLALGLFLPVMSAGDLMQQLSHLAPSAPTKVRVGLASFKGEALCARDARTRKRLEREVESFLQGSACTRAAAKKYIVPNIKAACEHTTQTMRQAVKLLKQSRSRKQKNDRSRTNKSRVRLRRP